MKTRKKNGDKQTKYKMIKISNIKRGKKTCFLKKNKNDNDNFSITTVKTISKIYNYTISTQKNLFSF